MKYSDHPMPLTEGEYPWEHFMQWDEEKKAWVDRWRQFEEQDIVPKPGPEEHEGYFIESDNEEYYDKETVCKHCRTRFIAYHYRKGEYFPDKVSNYCPGCGKVLAGEKIEEGE